VEPKLPKGVSLFSPTITIKDVPEEEVARQLTLMDFGIYAAIQVKWTIGVNSNIRADSDE